MAVNKTLYVKDEDAPFWDKARELAGESLSQFLTNHIKSFVAAKEAEATGLREKIILQYRDNGLPVAKSFYGRWIISPTTAHIEPKSYGCDKYAVAITAKNNIVAFNFFEEGHEIYPDKDGKFGWGKMYIFPSFEVALTSELPSYIFAEAIEKMGVEIEELDI